MTDIIFFFLEPIFRCFKALINSSSSSGSSIVVVVVELVVVVVVVVVWVLRIRVPN